MDHRGTRKQQSPQVQSQSSASTARLWVPSSSSSPSRKLPAPLKGRQGSPLTSRASPLRRSQCSSGHTESCDGLRTPPRPSRSLSWEFANRSEPRLAARRRRLFCFKCVAFLVLTLVSISLASWLWVLDGWHGPAGMVSELGSKEIPCDGQQRFMCTARWHQQLQQHVLLSSSHSAHAASPSKENITSSAVLFGAQRLCCGVSISESLEDMAVWQEKNKGQKQQIRRQEDIRHANCTSFASGSSTPNQQLSKYKWRRYLWVASVPEQVSKARQHLAEAATLAKLSGRTLVLPRVGSSHVGGGHLLPFCAYFDVERLGEYVPWVSEDFFWQSTRELDWQLKAKYLCLLHPALNSCAGAIGPHNNNAYMQLSSFALTQASLHDPAAAVVLHSGYHSRRDRDFETMRREEQELLKVLEKQNRVDLLAFIQSGYFFTLSAQRRAEGLRALAYAPYLEHEASQLGRKLTNRFLCIHLRMEFQVMQILKRRTVTRGLREAAMHCAQAAVMMTRAKMVEFNVSKVFLASDVSLSSIDNSIQLQTDSFVHSRDDSAVLNMVLTQALSLVTRELSPVTWEQHDATLVARDGGVRSILDKLTCARAVVFLQGSKLCGGGQNFDNEIEQLRDSLGKAQETTFVFGNQARNW